MKKSRFTTCFRFIAAILTIVLLLASCAETIPDEAVEEIPEENLTPESEDADIRYEMLCGQNRDIIDKSLKQCLPGADYSDIPVSEITSYLSATNVSTVYSDTEFTYYPEGEEALNAMIGSIRSANDYIFIEFFIIKEGTLWDEFFEILKEKAEAGVEVRILVDGYSARWFLPEDFLQKLEDAGIHSYVTAPILNGDVFTEMRDHRKIVIVDGKCVFTGGVNLADEYANIISLYGYWKDNAIRLEGGCVRSFILMFLQMWELYGEKTEYERYLSACEDLCENDNLCIPYCDGPLDDDRVGREIYMNLLRNSKEEVRIAVPYFVPDEEFIELMNETAERGVHITLVLPGTPDWPIVQLAGRTYYRELTDVGIDIYEYTPGFIHQKVFICDGYRCTVGSVNLDNRSLDGQFECGIYMCSRELADELNRDYDNILSVSTHMTESVMDELCIDYGDKLGLRGVARFF